MTEAQKLAKIHATLGHIERLHGELVGRMAVINVTRLSAKANSEACNAVVALKELSLELEYLREVLNT